MPRELWNQIDVGDCLVEDHPVDTCHILVDQPLKRFQTGFRALRIDERNNDTHGNPQMAIDLLLSVYSVVAGRGQVAMVLEISYLWRQSARARPAER